MSFEILAVVVGALFVVGLIATIIWLLNSEYGDRLGGEPPADQAAERKTYGKPVFQGFFGVAGLAFTTGAS